MRTLRKKLDYYVHGDLFTIWLRDVAGFNCGDRIVKPRFKPRYYRGTSLTASAIDCTMQVIHAILDKDLVKISVVWDGGNLVTDGSIGIVTDRIIDDHPKQSPSEIENIIRRELRIEPVFIPQLPGDALAHSDGYMAFVNQGTALLTEYPAIARRSDKDYTEKVKAKLLECNLNVIGIKDDPRANAAAVPRRGKCKGIESAKGVYVNFLGLNDTFIVPEYTYTSSDPANRFNAENRSILEQFGQVLSINCDALADYGGVRHCISFTD